MFLFCFCLSLKRLGFSSTARVANQCTSHLYLRIVCSPFSLCRSEAFSKCLLNQSELNVSYVATTLITYCFPNGHIFLPLYLCIRKLSGWAGLGKQSTVTLCTAAVWPWQRHSAQDSFGVSLFAPPLQERLMVSSQPTRQQGGRSGKSM